MPYNGLIIKRDNWNAALKIRASTPSLTKSSVGQLPMEGDRCLVSSSLRFLAVLPLFAERKLALLSACRCVIELCGPQGEPRRLSDRARFEFSAQADCEKAGGM